MRFKETLEKHLQKLTLASDEDYERNTGDLKIYEETPQKQCLAELSDLSITDKYVITQWGKLSATLFQTDDFNKFPSVKEMRLIKSLIGEKHTDKNPLKVPAINAERLIFNNDNGEFQLRGLRIESQNTLSSSISLFYSLLYILVRCENRLEALKAYFAQFEVVSDINHHLLKLKQTSALFLDLSEKNKQRFLQALFNDTSFSYDFTMAIEWLNAVGIDFLNSFLRYSVGLKALSDADNYERFIRQKVKFHPVIIEADSENSFHLDLSVESKALAEDSAFAEASAFQNTIEKMASAKSKKYGIGGYMETRPFYNTESYIRKSWLGNRWRTMHMGVDIWTEAGTDVYAPTDCEVYSAYDNAIKGDYGPTIILKSKNNAANLYFLYGHMSRKSLENLWKGKEVKQGEKLGKLGTEEENGGWPPHLHFQLIRSMFKYEHNYNGLCDPEFRDYWSQICPSPAPFLNVSNTLIESENPRSDNKYIRADGAKVYDHQAQRYLDFRISNDSAGYNRQLPEAGKLNSRITQLKSLFNQYEGNCVIEHENELIWNLYIVSDVPCLRNVYATVNKKLESAGFLLSKEKDGLKFQIPHCTDLKEVHDFLKILNRTVNTLWIKE